MKAASGLLGIAFAAAAVQCASAAELPRYRPQERVEGEIRIWGSPADRDLLTAWEAGFAKVHPAVRFSHALHGPESTIAGVYTGMADLAFMAREMRLPVESMAYEWVHRTKPFVVEVANGGLRPERPSANLAVFVHKDNPLKRMTLAQLDAILGAEHRRGSSNLRRWGELGLDGEWRNRPIRIHGPAVDSIPALFMRTAVMKDSRKWNPDYREYPSESEVLAALAHDLAGIAYAPVGLAIDGVKPLALAAADGGPWERPSVQSVAARTYPISRVVTMVLNRAPGRPINPKLREFLTYILSAEGQDAVARDGAHIPLSAQSAQRQRERLD